MDAHIKDLYWRVYHTFAAKSRGEKEFDNKLSFGEFTVKGTVVDLYRP